MSESIRYRSYAKVNLYLDVIGRRTDGFHDIETVFQTVSLADELTVYAQEGELSLECPPEIHGKGNLVYRAAELLRHRSGRRLGAHLKLVKQIPIAAGLAGGSGNGAAGLTALNRLWKLGMSRGELMELGLELGSDVPYCLVGGTAAATGRGEVLEPMAPIGETWFVLVHPPMAVSAASAYTSKHLVHSVEKPVEGKTPAFRRVIDDMAGGKVASVIFNRMETAVFAEHPQLDRMRRELLDAGCSAAAMSGSGPTVFGLCDSHEEGARIAASLESHRTSVVRSVAKGLEEAL